MKKLPHIKIKQIRKQRKFSQQYMADCLGVSQMAYSKIESNKTQLNWDKLTRISNILSINVWDIVDDTKEFETEHPDEMDFNDAITLFKQLLKKHDVEKKELLDEIEKLKKASKK